MSHYRDSEEITRVVEALRKLRDDHNLTCEDFYDKTGIHIGRIETGTINITISTLKRILDYYKVSMPEFFEKYYEKV